MRKKEGKKRFNILYFGSFGLSAGGMLSLYKRIYEKRKLEEEYNQERLNLVKKN